jgi:hypothetical protein
MKLILQVQRLETNGRCNFVLSGMTEPIASGQPEVVAEMITLQRNKAKYVTH